MTRTSASGLALIKRHEGFRPTAYKCPGGVWTIGYGHTRNVSEGDTTTLAQANDWLAEDIQSAEKAVLRYVTVPLTQNQFDALVSFTFNLGAGALAESTLLRKLNDGGYDVAANEFPRWVKAKGRVQAGLVARRAEERELFLRLA